MTEPETRGLREALAKYGRHQRGCHILMPMDSTVCTCGLAVALATPREADPMLGTPADGRHPDHGDCGQGPCPHIPRSAADHSGLDAAWAEAEAALPDTMWFDLEKRSDDGYNAVAFFKSSGTATKFARAATPAEALRNLARALRDRQSKP